MTSIFGVQESVRIRPNPTLYRIRPNPESISVGSKCPYIPDGSPLGYLSSYDVASGFCICPSVSQLVFTHWINSQSSVPMRIPDVTLVRGGILPEARAVNGRVLHQSAFSSPFASLRYLLLYLNPVSALETGGSEGPHMIVRERTSVSSRPMI